VLGIVATDSASESTIPLAPIGVLVGFGFAACQRYSGRTPAQVGQRMSFPNPGPKPLA